MNGQPKREGSFFLKTTDLVARLREEAGYFADAADELAHDAEEIGRRVQTILYAPGQMIDSPRVRIARTLEAVRRLEEALAPLVSQVVLNDLAMIREDLVAVEGCIRALGEASASEVYREQEARRSGQHQGGGDPES